MKRIGKIKRMATLGLTFLLSINSFATSVANNDGSAFITKAEFDALKSSFQSQIDTYNQGIDSKIDNAIAAYLSGININISENRDTYAAFASSKGFLLVDQTHPLNYTACWPSFFGSYIQSQVYSGQNTNGQYAYEFADDNKDDNKGQKTVIKDLDETKKIAKWVGYNKDCYDDVSLRYTRFDKDHDAGGIIDGWSGTSYIDIMYATAFEDESTLQNKAFVLGKGHTVSGSTKTWHSSWYWQFICNYIDNHWGTIKYPYVSVTKNFNYDMFSNQDRNKNWGYKGSYMTRIGGASNKVNAKADTFQSSDWSFLNSICSFTYNVWQGKINSSKFSISTATRTAKNWYQGFYSQDNATVEYVPIVGFETKYLTNWNNIYDENYDLLFDNKDYDFSSFTTDSILVGSDGKKHLSLAGGVPITVIKKDEELESMELKFSFNTGVYVWFSTEPFPKDTCGFDKCLTNIDGTGIVKDSTKDAYAYKVSGESCKLHMPKVSVDTPIFIKCEKIGGSGNESGGLFYPPSIVTIRKDS